MAHEPAGGKAGDLFQRPRLLEEVRRSRDDLQFLLDAQLLQRLPVHLDHGNIVSPHDQERRSPNAGEGIPRKVRTPPARDERADFLVALGRRHQRGPGSGAGAEVAHAQVSGVRISLQPVGGADESFGKHPYVEPKVACS